MTYGILGLGSIGLRHATNLKSLGKEVIAFDPSPERLDTRALSGIKIVKSRRQVLKNAGAVIICSPNANHFEDIKAAVSANCHVFVEKPLATKSSGLKDILDRASSTGRHVFAGLNLRFHPAAAKAKQILEQGKLGDHYWAIFQSSHYLPDWRPGQDYRKGYTADPQNGGVLFDIIHEFDLANYLLGPAYPVAAASRTTGAIEIQSEDCADVILRHASGTQSSIHLDYVTRPTRRWVEIGGRKGILKIDLVKRRLVLVNSSDVTVKQLDFNSTNSDDDYLAEMKAFIRSVEHGVAPVCDGYAALQILEQVISVRQKCGLPAA